MAVAKRLCSIKLVLVNYEEQNHSLGMVETITLNKTFNMEIL
jgi:hypothetical protein